MKDTHPPEADDRSVEEHDHLTWRRVHPLTPLANTWKVFAALFAFFIWHNTDTISRGFEDGWLSVDTITTWLPYILLGVLGITVLVGLYSWLAWRRMEFAIGDQAVWFRRGIISRSERHSRLDRIQSVDITHPLLGRICGLGSLNITVAGGSDATLQIGLLSSTHMVQVQQEIMDRVYGVADAEHVIGPSGTTDSAATSHHVSASDTTSRTSLAQDSTGMHEQSSMRSRPLHESASPSTAPHSSATGSRQRPEIPVFEVSTSRLLGSLALSGFLISLIIFILATIATVIIFVKLPGPSPVVLGTTLITLLVGFGSTFWSRLSQEFGFKAQLSADGIHIQHGLTDTVAETIPPRRIHAVQIQQSWLWRRFGWYRVTMTVAGKRNAKEMLESTTLLPVGTLQEALLAVWLVEPDLGVADPAHMMTVAMGPANADTVLAAANSEGHTQPVTHVHADGDVSGDLVHPNETAHTQLRRTPRSPQRTLRMVVSPKTAQLFDPFTWQRNATVLTDTVLMHRGGWLSRFISVIPLSHVQSWEWHQGPWDRQRHVARIQPNLVRGVVKVDSGHLEEALSQSLLHDLSEASQHARGSETRADWSQRIQALQRS